MTELAVARVTVAALAVWYLVGMVGATLDRDPLFTVDLAAVGGWWAFAWSADTTRHPGAPGPAARPAR